MAGRDWPATWGDGSIRIGYLVSVDRGQYLSFQVPDVDAGVGGGAHDELACGEETQNQLENLWKSNGTENFKDVFFFNSSSGLGQTGSQSETSWYPCRRLV